MNLPPSSGGISEVIECELDFVASGPDHEGYQWHNLDTSNENGQLPSPSLPIRQCVEANVRDNGDSITTCGIR